MHEEGRKKDQREKRKATCTPPARIQARGRKGEGELRKKEEESRGSAIHSPRFQRFGGEWER